MQLTDKIHVLRIDFEISLSADKKIPRFVNVILVFGDKITLIDTGVRGSENKIFDYIENLGYKKDEIDIIILSHSHPDHIGSATEIKRLTNCKVISHRLEKEWIEDIELQNKERPVPGFFNLVDKAVIIDSFVEDNQDLKVHDELTLKFIKSSGHSKGSLNVLFVEERILFTADSIPLKNDIPNYDSYIDLMQSLEMIRESKDYDVLLTSWTLPLTNKQEIERLIEEGEDYMKHIDSVVKECYSEINEEDLINCRLAVNKLGLPPFLVNPIVDKAFRSHFS